jgi:hypothetical protein
MLQLNRPEDYETTTELDIDERHYVEIRSAFMAHMGEDGAHFLKPHRLDLFRKPYD